MNIVEGRADKKLAAASEFRGQTGNGSSAGSAALFTQHLSYDKNKYGSAQAPAQKQIAQ
jgi:predicted negative regulator of RcsB-dependent stress response